MPYPNEKVLEEIVQLLRTADPKDLMGLLCALTEEQQNLLLTRLKAIPQRLSGKEANAGSGE
jgi:hypothetical protein